MVIDNLKIQQRQSDKSETTNRRTATLDDMNVRWMTRGFRGVGSGVTHTANVAYYYYNYYSYLSLGLEWGTGCRKRTK